jgi:hypothetical protein
MKKYDVKSGKIEYTLKGSGNIMGMVKIKSVGKKRVIFCPALAPIPDIEEPAFPVEASTISSMPCFLANADTIKEARSLKEPVGFSASSLM